MAQRYQNIDHDEFAEAVLEIARENIDATLRLPGIWEVISEEYNNEALDRALDRRRDSRRAHLLAVMESIRQNGFFLAPRGPNA